MLQLQPEFEKYQDKGLNVVTITSDGSEEIRELWNKHQIPGKVFIDENSKIFASYGVRHIPVGVFVGKDGYMKDMTIGWDESYLEPWREKVEQLLEDSAN